MKYNRFGLDTTQMKKLKTLIELSESLKEESLQIRDLKRRIKNLVETIFDDNLIGMNKIASISYQVNAVPPSEILDFYDQLDSQLFNIESDLWSKKQGTFSRMKP